jgi:hypothetical protein
MAKQSAGRPIPPVPRGGQPGRSTTPSSASDAAPVSPAVKRAREGAAAAQGHGQGGGSGK